LGKTGGMRPHTPIIQAIPVSTAHDYEQLTGGQEEQVEKGHQTTPVRIWLCGSHSEKAAKPQDGTSRVSVPFDVPYASPKKNAPNVPDLLAAVTTGATIKNSLTRARVL
jgi:hypothetical protein